MIRDGLSAQERAQRMHAIGVVAVAVLWLPMVFWLLHLSSLAAIVPYIHNNPEKWWLAWVDTGVFAAGTIVCIVVSILVGVSVDAHEDVGTAEGRTRFLGWQGVLAGLANLALILAEGSYALFISAGHR